MKNNSKFKNQNSKLKVKNQSYSSGFTLIELLIVISIIGVLATILLANFIGVRQKARDAQRKADVRQIQAAIELYKADQGSYPAVLYSANCPTPSSLVGGTVTYLTKIPCDPKPIGGTSWYSQARYAYGSDGLSYDLYVCLENKNDMGPDTSSVTSNSPCNGATPTNPFRVYHLTNP